MDTRKIRRFFRRAWIIISTENPEYTSEEQEEVIARQGGDSSYNPTTGISMSSCGVDSTGRTIGSSYHY